MFLNIKQLQEIHTLINNRCNEIHQLLCNRYIKPTVAIALHQEQSLICGIEQIVTEEIIHQFNSQIIKEADPIQYWAITVESEARTLHDARIIAPFMSSFEAYAYAGRHLATEVIQGRIMVHCTENPIPQD